MSAGRLKKNGLSIAMLLCVGLLLAGCSGSKSSDTGSYSGSVYTVKRGDTLYRISRATGTSPIYYGSGYLPTADYWRLGAIFGLIFLVLLVITGLVWMPLVLL